MSIWEVRFWQGEWNRSNKWVILRDNKWVAETENEPDAQFIKRCLRLRELAGEEDLDIAIAAHLNRPESPTKDQRPHSRACGMVRHPHGTACSSDCPTCNGRSQEWFDKHNLQMGPGDFDRPRDVPVTKSYVDGQLPRANRPAGSHGEYPGVGYA